MRAWINDDGRSQWMGLMGMVVELDPCVVLWSLLSFSARLVPSCCTINCFHSAFPSRARVLGNECGVRTTRLVSGFSRSGNRRARQARWLSHGVILHTVKTRTEKRIIIVSALATSCTIHTSISSISRISVSFEDILVQVRSRRRGKRWGGFGASF